MQFNIIFNTSIALWLYLCLWFAIISCGFALVYFSVAILIKSLINLEGRIRTAEVWREAINDWLIKHNKK